MSKALEAVVKAAHARGFEGYYGEGCLIMPFEESDARAIIAAFLEASGEDEGVLRDVDGAIWLSIDGKEPPTTLNGRASEAAILALKRAAS